MMKTACVHRMCSLCSVGLSQNLLKNTALLQNRMLEEKLAYYFTLLVQTYGTPYIELVIFVVTAPRRKTVWFQQ
jgi:hypothetical protein